MISFFFLNSIVFWSSHLLGGLFSRNETIRWDIWILKRSILYFFLIFSSEIILSLFHILHYENLWIFHGILFLSILFIFCILFFLHKRKSNIQFISKIIPPSFSPINIFWSIVFFIPIFLIGSVRFFNAFFQVPLEYDNLAYHLPFITKWFQTGNIWTPYYSAFSGPIGYYPSNFELFGLWTIFPTSSDLLINFINLPVFFFLPIAIYALAKKIGLSSPLSILTVAVFMYMPQTFRQIGVPLVDLFFVYTFVSAWVFFLEYQKQKNAFDIWILAISTGLFIGTKYLGVPYSFPIIFITIISIISYTKGSFIKVKHLFLFLLGGFLAGGFWYTRNWIETLNPLFPTHVEFSGNTIFEGYQGFFEKLEKTSLFANIVSWEDSFPVLEKIFLMIGGSSFLIIASIFLALLIIPFRPFVQIFRLLFSKPYTDNSPIHLGVFLFLFFLFLFYIGLYIYAPYTFQDLFPNVRYAMTGLIVGSLFVGGVISFFPQLLQCLFLVISSGIFIWTLLNQVLYSSSHIIGNDKILLDAIYIVVFKEWFLFFLFTLIAFISGFFLFFHTKFWLKKWISIAILLIAPLWILMMSLYFSPFREALFLPESIKWYSGSEKNNHFLSLIQSSIWLNNQNIKGSIAYTGFNLHYPLFGRSLERNVQYININNSLNGDYNDFKNIQDSIRSNPDKNAWFENLKLKKIKYLVISERQNPDILLYEIEWVNSMPEHFIKVYEKEGVIILKVIF